MDEMPYITLPNFGITKNYKEIILTAGAARFYILLLNHIQLEVQKSL